MLCLVPLQRLEHLELCGGHLSDRGIEVIAKMPSLTSLNLSQNRCDSLGVCAVCLALTRVFGSRNIRTKALFHLRALTELQFLNLSNTSVTALSLRHLYRELLTTLSNHMAFVLLLTWMDTHPSTQAVAVALRLRLRLDAEPY